MKRFTLILFTILQVSLWGQSSFSTSEDESLKLFGYLRDYESQQSISDATIIVNNNKGQQVIKEVNFAGVFEFYLPIEGVYNIVFSSPDRVSKTIIVDCIDIPESDKEAGFQMGPMKIGLFEKIDSIDYSILDQPIGKSRYNTTTEQLEWDKDYSQKMLAISDSFFDNLHDKVATNIEQKIDSLINNWHLAAANADEDIYFNSMTDDAIFLGTDKTERWEKEVFEKWAEPHFEKEKAWDFTPHHREIYIHSDQKIAWFEELLDTWMGTCRGSGVVVLTEEGWKIKHFNLALLVDNDKMKKVIEVIEK